MTIRTALLRGAALGVFAAVATGFAAQAETADGAHHHRRHREVKVVRVVREGGGSEVAALRAEVEELKARLDAQGAQQQATAAQVAQTQNQVAEVASNTQSNTDKIETIPEQVLQTVGELPKPKTDKFYYKGVTITPGGFLEATGIYRQHNQLSDIATNFNQVPFKNNAVGKAEEFRGTARQSRLSLLVQGDAKPDVHLAMYGEFDFQAAAQTANSNQTNSYNPRIRHLYGTVDWDNFAGSDFGLHLLAGQNWSLATMNTKGITPRNELTPPQIDAQYIPGFVFTRQPQVRVTADALDHTLWGAISLENPATTTVGVQPATATVGGAGQSGFNSANQVSLNKYPDVIAKVAYEVKAYDRTLHLEAFGIARNFYDRHATLIPTSNGRENQDTWTGGGGFGAVLQAIPSVLDLQVSGLAGKGIGRYGASALPDATFQYDGKVEPINEVDWLAGGTFHALPVLDIYAFAGREQEERQSNTSFAGANYGLGNVLLDARACSIEVAALVPAGQACNVQTRSIQQETVGFWHKFYQGGFGRAQWGVQYSYTERKSFTGVGGVDATGDNNMVFVSFRYYPF